MPMRLATRCLAGRSSQGFTLIELLVAISVMALLALMSWQGLDGMARAQELHRVRGDAVLILQTSMSQWDTDLDAAFAPSQTRAMDWDGRALRITRRTTATAEAAVQVVAWSVREGPKGPYWHRWQSPPFQTRPEWQQAWDQAAAWAQDGSAGNGAAVALVPADGWQLLYFRQDNWAPAVPTQSLDAGSTTPDGIRLVLSLPPGSPLFGVIQRDWVRPAFSVAKSSS